MKKGKIRDITNEKYHADTDYVSASKMKNVFTSMQHYANPPVFGRKTFFDIGTAFELMLTDKEAYFKDVVIINEAERPEKDKGMSSGINIAWKKRKIDEAKGSPVITPVDHELITAMVKECKKNKVIMDLLKIGIYQISVFWEDENGLKVKSRPDIVIYLSDETCIVIDIKSTKDASPQGYLAQSQKLYYPFQAIMQIKAMESVGYEVQNYYWLAVEKDLNNPMAQLYEFLHADQEPLRDAYDRISKKIVRFNESKKASGYEEGCDNEYGVKSLVLSDFYINKMRNI